MKYYKVEIKLSSGDKFIYQSMSEKILNLIIDAKNDFIGENKNSTMTLITDNAFESNVFFVIGDIIFITYKEVV